VAADLATPLRAEYERRLREPSDIQDHLQALHSHATGWQFCAILELGTRGGNSTAAFLAALQAAQYPGCLHSIDVNAPDVPQAWHQLPYWRFLQADDLSPEARMWVPDRLNVLFIDTSHEYGHTLAELRAYGPRVRRGGLILMHDTEYAYADGAHLKDIPPHESEVGRALDAWCAETGLEWVNHPGCYGLGVIRVP